MIIRVFRVRIHPRHRDAFEAKFRTQSVQVVESQEGFDSVTIAKPTRWAPDEYLMVSKWQSEAALEAFVGPHWNQAHIPPDMATFVAECWVHHYAEFD
mgnify:CR=1 FL=1|jgi:heme-degrading monooxygenase HmoA